MPFPFFDETKELNDSVRKGANGSFIALSDGITHYELSGDEHGIPVVMIHGFSTPYFIFDVTFEFLTKSGFRVLRYDLFGRGLSDRPRLTYDIHLYVRQLKDLLDILKIKPVNLLGLSMGGPVSASFTYQYPDYVKKLILIDPAGVKPVALSMLIEITKLPVMGELALSVFGNTGLIKGIAKDMFTPELVAHFEALYKEQMQYAGFKRALLSSMRNHMLDSFIETYRRVGTLGKPILLFWGKEDRTVPFEDSTILMKVIPHVELHAFENCGHLPHYEKSIEVNPILLEFLKRGSAS